ncbi:MAG TPA: FAD-dependent oxidoreductase [Methylotenera sp.]|nr:FAD-dependent oxidoreductase [Methylotenera sp.]
MSDNILKVDVTIVGAGLVGLSAAVAISQAGHEVVLVDQQAHAADSRLPESDLDWDQRIYAISPKNVQWLSSLGVWQLLDNSRIGEMQAMEIWGDATAKPLSLLAEDDNADDLGFIVEERALRKALIQQVQACGVRTFLGCKCKVLNSTSKQAILELDTQQVIESSLLIAADGVNSWIRQQLGIAVEQKDYKQTAIVANFSTEKPHGNIARQWFRQDATSSDTETHCGILAWLPLPGNNISIVWSAPSKYAEYLMQLEASAFSHEVMQAGNAALGQLTMIGSPAAFPLLLKKAEDLVRGSVVLAGDAAHRIHPMAGQGVNLGFRDIVDLMEILASRHLYQPMNDSSLLKRYTRARKADISNMLILTNGLYHLFDSQNPAVQKVRSWGLSATNQQSIKKKLVRQAIAL